MNTNLLDTTLELAKASDLPVPRICEATGVSLRWYYKLLSGELKDPSVRRIQRLHDYLRANSTIEEGRRKGRSSAAAQQGDGAETQGAGPSDGESDRAKEAA